MRHIGRIGLIGLVMGSLVAQAADVQFTYGDFGQRTQAYRPLLVYPLLVSATNDAGVTTLDRIAVRTDVNGSATISNVIPGYLRAEFYGLWRTSTNYYQVPNSNGLVLAKDCLLTNTLVGGPLPSPAPWWGKAELVAGTNIYFRTNSGLTYIDGSGNLNVNSVRFLGDGAFSYRWTNSEGKLELISSYDDSFILSADRNGNVRVSTLIILDSSATTNCVYAISGSGTTYAQEMVAGTGISIDTELSSSPPKMTFSLSGDGPLVINSSTNVVGALANGFTYNGVSYTNGQSAIVNSNGTVTIYGFQGGSVRGRQLIP